MRTRPLATPAVIAGIALCLLAGCASDPDDATPSAPSIGDSSSGDSTGASTDSPPASAPPASTAAPGDDVVAVVADEPFPDERCAINEEVGTITYLTGFDFAATASIVDVIVADAKGYYEDLCLDVELTPSFSTANYPLIAANDAQFASGGSFSEVVAYADANDTEFVVTSVEGRTAIDGLIVKPGLAGSLEDLEGTTIGVKGKIPASIAAMLGSVDLREGEDYETVLLDGFDPTAHIAIESIAGFPGWKSNEPGTLERAGIAFDLFDPVAYDIPGSFGAIYTSRAFAEANPSVVDDFMRATMKGLADALADPDAAVAEALALINAGGNPNFLSEEGETFRWNTDAALILETTPEGTGVGEPDPEGLQFELDTYGEFGLFGDREAPDALAFLSDSLSRVYDDGGTLVWPA